MADIVEEIRAATAAANAIWTGTRYVVVSTGNYWPTDNISSITFGQETIEYINTSELSTLSHMVPVAYKPGTITFEGATIRDTGLYERFYTQQTHLKGELPYKPENLIIFTYEYQSVGTQVQGTFTPTIPSPVPISIVVAAGCNPVSYRPANANANGTTIPVEQLVVQPHDLYRVTNSFGALRV